MFKGPFTLADSIKGYSTYNYFLNEKDSTVFNGRFSFNSDIQELESGNSIRQVNILGNFKNGRKNGDWTYEINEYKIVIKKLTGLQVNASLNGTQKRITGKYDNGKANGKWVLAFHEVRESQKKGRNANSELTFSNGIATGSFIFEDESDVSPFSIQGQFDQQGNFDGIWKLTYQLENDIYDEQREYNSGFLLSLLITNKKTNEKFRDETFDDVKEKLQVIDKNGQEINFKRGEKTFDILFDDGYRSDDTRITSQAFGNDKLKYAFSYFADTTSSIFKIKGFDIPIVGKTRRFQYVYPEEEEQIIKTLSPKIGRLISTYESIINSSSIRVNMQKNDSLAFFYEYLGVAISKLSILDTVANEIKEGKFDYLFRDNFYSNGIERIEAVDTIKYSFAGGSKYKLVSFSDGIKSPENLVFNMKAYVDSLENYTNGYLKYTNETLKVFQQEERIEEMDEKIVQMIDRVQLTYTGTIKSGTGLSDEELEENSQLNEFQRAVYKTFANDRKNFRIQNYSNAKNYDEKIERGESVIELMQLLLDIHQDLQNLGGLKKKLDEAFTRYSPNPFFERDVVTRIKPSIYSRGTEILFPYLIQDLKKANNRTELKERLSLILKFEEKMLELASRDDDDVNRLNTRLRRENQPERIKRLLGL